jgi:hypothetical protein
MSALGHKQTCTMQWAMSALPPIATAKALPQKAMSAFPPKADIHWRSGGRICRECCNDSSHET